MKKLFFFSLILLFATACKDDDCCVTPPPVTDNFKLTFKTKTQDGRLVLFENFTLEDGTLFNMNKLQFYISNIRLLQGSNETKIADVEKVSFETHATAEVAAAGETFTFSETPVGDFDGIRFGIGVEPGLNAIMPGNHPDGHLLNAGIDYWSNWNSYIFAKIEGYFDANGNEICGGGDDDEEVTYHTGMDDLYREKTIPATISVSDTEAREVVIIVDVDKIFNAIEAIDFTTEPVAHSNPLVESFMITTNKVADNFVEALSLE